MTCEKCGATVGDVASFCPACGAAVKQTSSGDAPITPSPYASVPLVVKRTGRTKYVVAAGTIVAALLVVGGFAVSRGGAPSGFNDPDALAKDIGVTYNRDSRVLADSRLIVTNVGCIQTAEHSFDCHFTTVDGSWVTSYTVSADGSAWMPKAGQ